MIAADGTKPDKGDKGDKVPKSERREMRRTADGASNNNNDARPTPVDAQARTQAKLRERLEITDDEEWTVISERINRVEELRRVAAGGPSSNADRGKRGGKEGTGAEREALRAALADRLPDAEIRSRLSRVAEVQQQNTAKLTRAQEELRAVLTVRQEAIAVMFGLLAP